MLLADVFFDVRMFGEFPAGMQSLQRRARRHATINVVDFNDVTRCQNMVDVSDVTTCQNKHARVFCVCDMTE